MHDLDPMQSQYEAAGEIFESDQFEYGYEGESGFDSETDAESPFSDAEVTDLAAELLAVSDEGELDQFLGGLFKKVGRGLRRFMKGGVGRALGGLLKGVAKKALPFVGGALGSVVPGVGTAIGGALGSAASNLFELPLDAMSQEDQEFSQARRFVQLASGAAKKAGLLPPGFDPGAAARAALAAAAKKYAPRLFGLLGETGAGPMPGAGPGAASAGVPMRPGQSGRWIRRGRRIIVIGV